jgi:uncharacterized iron-regulated protein
LACSQKYRSDETVYAATLTERNPIVGKRVPIVVEAQHRQSLERLLAAVETRRIIFAGATRDRYDHHLNQLVIIRGLDERGVDLAVGMEFFQEPFQPYHYQLVAGSIDETTLLKEAEYYERLAARRIRLRGGAASDLRDARKSLGRAL